MNFNVFDQCFKVRFLKYALESVFFFGKFSKPLKVHDFGMLSTPSYWAFNFIQKSLYEYEFPISSRFRATNH